MANIKDDRTGGQRIPTTTTNCDLQNQAFRDTDASHRFQPPQSTFRLSRRVRPPPILLTAGAEDPTRVALSPKKLDRRTSKGGLRGMFTRTKVQPEHFVVSPVMEGPPAGSAVAPTVPERPKSTAPGSLSIRRATSTSQATPVTPVKPTGPPTRINLRSRSVRQSRVPNKSSSKPTNSPPRAPSRASPAWDPPPLFQAYPQSVRHATLIASTLSADAILRMNHHRRNNSLRNEIAQIRPGGGGQAAAAAAAKKTERARSKHRRQLSGSISKADWTHKIFVLVTSGYLLQYAGEGSFDRLPEKMMQLGKESVAFASDAIPGKHWVVQVSQSMDADGAPAADPRSLLSRLTFRGADYRRTSTSFLLVLNSAEQMDAWLAVLRREIEALGGKKQISETGKPKADDKVMELKAQPSHRYLIQRDPDQFSNPSTPRTPSGFPPWNDNQLQQKLDGAASNLAASERASTRLSMENNSATNSVASHDGRQLENLRDSTNRLSYMSADQRTLITSQGSSITNSPTKESCSTSDDFPQKVSLDETRLRPNASAINERRRSMQTTTIPILEANTPRNFRHSTYGGPVRLPQGRSPTTANFSAANLANNRFPIKVTSPNKGVGRDSRNIPNIVTTTPSKIGQPVFRAKGKSLSPLRVDKQQLPSVRGTVAVLTPIEPSTEDINGAESSSDYTSTRFSGTNPAPVKANIPVRRSSLVPLDARTIIDFQPPQQHPYASNNENAYENIPEPSIRPSLPPTPPTVSPLSTSPPIPQNSSKDQVAKPKVEKEPLNPLPVLSFTTPKLRRPMSMQIRSSNLAANATRPTTRASRSPTLVSPPNHGITAETLPASNPTSTTGIKPLHSTTTATPALQRLRSEEDPKNLASRRSMPLLVSGPPPAPPPDCALPPLPPTSGGSKVAPKSPSGKT